MSDHAAAISPSEAAELEAESHVPYLKVWFGLLVLTVVEYFYARIFMDHFTLLILGLLFWAIIKACMVGWYFMHLKFEKPWVYFMIVPALLLATILTLALCPDMVLKFEDPEEAEPPIGAGNQAMRVEAPSFVASSVFPSVG